MSGVALDYTYRYRFASELTAARPRPHLRLATGGGADDYPYFFKGTLAQPQRTAELLRGLVRCSSRRSSCRPPAAGRTLVWLPDDAAYEQRV